MDGPEQPGERPLTRRRLLGAMAGGALALAGVARPRRALGAEAHRGPESGRRDRPPNILFILSDNHRWDAMGCMNHPFVQTPQLDRLAREGLLFTNAFCTTPLCSPARASFLTGLYAWRHGVRNNNTRSRWNPRLVTFLELLKEKADYATAFIGKWHMPASGLPHLRGVDHFVTFTIQDGQGRYFDCPLVSDGKEVASRKHYITEELTDRALAFIEAHRSEPFCVYLSHKAVHRPWRPPPDLEGLYANAPVRLPREANAWTGFTDGEIWGGFTRPVQSVIRAYMATVTAMDRQIGRLLERLDHLGLARDTVVVYTSDNGFLFGEHKHVELRWPFEEALRLPLLVRCPRLGQQEGRRPAQMALNIDMAPTFLELAGIAPPGEMQGMSLAPVLRGAGAPGRRAFLVEDVREFPYTVPAYQGVRTERYLYVEYQGGFAPTLHDVARDPKQRHDLMVTPEGRRVLPELQEMLAALRRGERFDG